MPLDPDRLLDYAAEAASPAGLDLIGSLRDVKPLGHGEEKLVYDFGHDKVIAFLAPSNAHVLKKRYYTQKLFHLLMPANIPDAHLVGSEPPVMVLDKITEGEQLPYTERRDAEDDVALRLRALGARLVDMAPGNFMRNPNGDTYYVDTVEVDKKTEELLNAIAKMNEDDKKKALRYAGRAGVRLT